MNENAPTNNPNDIQIGDRVETDYGRGRVKNWVLSIFANVHLDDGRWLMRPPSELRKLTSLDEE